MHCASNHHDYVSIFLNFFMINEIIFAFLNVLILVKLFVVSSGLSLQGCFFK